MEETPKNNYNKYYYFIIHVFPKIWKIVEEEEEEEKRKVAHLSIYLCNLSIKEDGLFVGLAYYYIYIYIHQRRQGRILCFLDSL
jgi:hypothetical protein